jgi:hypothetical protein
LADLAATVSTMGAFHLIQTAPLAALINGEHRLGAIDRQHRPSHGAQEWGTPWLAAIAPRNNDSRPRLTTQQSCPELTSQLHVICQDIGQ